MNDIKNEAANQMEDLLGQALAGKYTLADGVLKVQLIRPALEKYRRVLVADLPPSIPVEGVADDVRNQVVTLLRLEKDWAARIPPNLDLTTIHQALYGDRGQGQAFRTSQFVEDYDGSPPTQLSEIAASLQKINSRLSLVDDLRGEPLALKADYLAWVVSKVIAVHAFVDGNGRLARVAAQYCLRRWGMDFIPIPKVRNAPRYKAALHHAIDGERSALADYFQRLIGKEPVRDIELEPVDVRRSQ
jgi:fido (protein-threonine AMPylation protein)